MYDNLNNGANINNNNNNKNISKKSKSHSVNNTKNDYYDDTATFDLELKQTRTNTQQLIDLNDCSQDDTRSQILFYNDDFNNSLTTNTLEISTSVNNNKMNTSTNNLLNLNDDVDSIAHPAGHQHTQSCMSHASASNHTWHCHTQSTDDKNAKLMRNRSARIKLILVTLLCVLFMVAEIVGGVLADSLAIQTDAAHMATDLAGFLLSLFAIHMSNKESTKRMSFGFYRTEILGALASTLLIWVLTGVLVYLAILRVINNDFDIEPKFMIITASCGVFFNILMAIVLHTNVSGINVPHHGHSHAAGAHGHSHSDSLSRSHSHLAINCSDDETHQNNTDSSSIASVSSTIPIFSSSTTALTTKSTTVLQRLKQKMKKPSDKETYKNTDSSNINIRAATIHVLGDILQSLGVLIAAIIIYFKVRIIALRVFGLLTFDCTFFVLL
jgi:cation diffusion facilitator family transporter